MFGLLKKNTASRTFFAIALLMLGLGSLASAQTSAGSQNIPHISTATGSVILDSWRVIGPFEGGTGLELLDRNLAGGAATTGDEAGDAVRHATTSSYSTRSQNITAAIVDLKMVYDQSYEPTVPPSAAYLLCTLVNDQARQPYLMLGSHDALKVWLNGKIIYEQREARRFDLYADSVKIDLPAGENQLCLKTVRTRQGWSVAARLAADLNEASVIALQSHTMLAGRLLPKCLLSSGEPLVFTPFGLPEGARLSYSVRDFAKTWEKRSELVGRTVSFPESQALPADLYWAEVTAGGQIYSQPFIVGSSAALAAKLIGQADALALDEPGRLNVEALKRRIAFLLRPENLRQDRTLVHALTELAGVVKASQAREEPFKAVAGLHIRAFRSRIDDQVQYYRLFVPSTYKADQKLPLAVLLPTTASSAKPFVESAFMSAHSEAERMSVLAEKYGLAILWCGYRKVVQTDPAEFAHINEVIDAVGRDYAIDPDRITLAGSCSAGAMAAGLAVREPGKFAAVALHNAVFGVHKTTKAEVVRSCYANADFRRWVLSTSSKEEYLAQGSLPTLLVHDGAEVGHGDLEISVKFVEMAQQYGRPVTLERVPQTVSQHFGAYDRILCWLAQARRQDVKVANTPRAKTIHEVFTERFLVVSASGGAAAEQSAVAKLRDQFAADWRASMFGDCRSRDEKSLAPKDSADGHLVLIGNPASSALWADLGPKAGISVEADKVRIGNRVWEGKNLSIQARLDHPEVRGQSVVFIGGNDLSKVNPATMNLAMDGWYQYAIWDPQGKLVDAGTL